MRPSRSRPDRSCSPTRTRSAAACRSSQRLLDGATGRPLPRGPRPAAVPVVGRSRLRAAHVLRDRSAVRDLGGHPTARRGARRGARPDDQPHLAPEPRVPGLRASRSPIAACGPVHHRSTRSGPAAIRHAADIDRIVLRKPDSPFSTITIGDDWRAGAGLDVVRHCRLVGAGRPRRHRPSATRAPDHGLAAVPSPRNGVRHRPPRRGRHTSSRSPARAASWSNRRSTSSSAGSTEEAASLGLTVLPEVHDAYATHRAARRNMACGRTTSCCPGWSSTRSRRATRDALAEHLAASPDRVSSRPSTAMTAFPIRPDLDGILAPARCSTLADACRAAGRQRQPHPVADRTRPTSTSTSSTAPTTRRSAATTTATSPLGPSSCSRAASRRSTTSGCSPATNDHGGVERTGEGRAINRHDYTLTEIEDALDRPVVQRLLELIRLRNTHPAFDGTLEVALVGDTVLRLSWRLGSSTCSLEVDVSSGRVTVDDSLARSPEHA